MEVLRHTGQTVHLTLIRRGQKQEVIPHPTEESAKTTDLARTVQNEEDGLGKRPYDANGKLQHYTNPVPHSCFQFTDRSLY